MKMHLYRAETYYALIESSTLGVTDASKIDKDLISKYDVAAKESFKKVIEDPKKTYKEDAEAFINFRVEMAFNMGLKMYTDKKFDMATQLFASAYKLSEYILVDNKDAYTNASLSIHYAVEDYIAKKEYDKALKLSEMGIEIMPKNIDIVIGMVNICLQKGDMVATEKYVNKALSMDPNNKQLYYVLGTSYIDLKQNEKAEESLRKALSIDPEYVEAQYQLGAHLYNWALEVKAESGKLDYKDPKVAQLEKQSDDLLRKSVEILEKYIGKNPNDKPVLSILYQTFYRLGDEAKFKEYKTRHDAIK
jgi:Tfp pilus assembly protein PilF